ncbi:MAG: GMP synthase (glutamine-hydrolyzing) [Paraglaciecola sp.]|jgi:GMP synthase (glutamine-hydrolysing)
MHIHFVIHESYEGPGAFQQWINDRNYKSTYTRLYLGDKLPTRLNFDLIVVLGGPQSPLTTIAECSHFCVESEIAFIRRCIEANKALIGVCLGAQLIGAALDATFEQSPYKEIGYFPITLTDKGRNNSKLAHFENTEIVGHWHNDMPGIPPTANVLALSEGCPRQIVEYSDIIYGFQCHLELTQDSIRDLVKHAFDDNLVDSEKWVQSANVLLETETAEMNALLFTFLDRLVENLSKKSNK